LNLCSESNENMVIKPENFPERINSYSEQDWKPLLDLIPKIEKVEKFGDDTESMKLLEKGIIDMNPYVENKIVEEFRQACYAVPIIIDFDWGEWEEGKAILQNDDFDYYSIDLPTKCKLITTIVRADRFSEGFLVRCFESGLMLKILKSIKKDFLP